MNVVVDRRPTTIHEHVPGFEWSKDFTFFGFSIIERYWCLARRGCLFGKPHTDTIATYGITLRNVRLATLLVIVTNA